MGVILTQFTGVAGTGTLSKAFTSSVAIGDLIAVSISSNGGTIAGVPSDGINSYSLLGTVVNTSTVGLFYAIATTAATLTITAPPTTFGAMGLADFNPGGGTWSLDGSPATNTGSSTAPSCGSTGNAGDLIIGAIEWRSAGSLTSTFGVGFNQPWVSGVNIGGAMPYQIGASGATNLSGTLSTSAAWAAVAQAFSVSSTAKVVPFRHLFGGMNFSLTDTP